MHRIDTDGHVGNMFDEGDPGVPRLPTQVDSEILNAFQEELANAIEDLGGTLVKNTNNQLSALLTALIPNLLAAVNSWAEQQTFAKGLIANGGSDAGAYVNSGTGAIAALYVTASGSGSLGATVTSGAGAVGVEIVNGTSATGGTRQDGLKLVSGDISLATVADPTKTTAISDRLTPMNIPKMWAQVALVDNGAGGASTVSSGFNVTSVVQAVDGTITVTIAADMASGNYLVVATANSAGRACYAYSRAAGSFAVDVFNTTTGVKVDQPGTDGLTIDILVFGAQ